MRLLQITHENVVIPVFDSTVKAPHVFNLSTCRRRVINFTPQSP